MPFLVIAAAAGYASLAAAAMSLFVLLSGAAVADNLPGTAAKVTAGVLTATGTALATFLAATFQKSYVMASRQMSYYYGQPLVHCYLLHAEWLASVAAKHPGSADDMKLWQEIIKASLRAGAHAQDHLLTMEQDTAAWPGARPAHGFHLPSFRPPAEQDNGADRGVPSHPGQADGSLTV